MVFYCGCGQKTISYVWVDSCPSRKSTRRSGMHILKAGWGGTEEEPQRLVRQEASRAKMWCQREPSIQSGSTAGGRFHLLPFRLFVLKEGWAGEGDMGHKS